jgi:hypothetical protein
MKTRHSIPTLLGLAAAVAIAGCGEYRNITLGLRDKLAGHGSDGGGTTAPPAICGPVCAVYCPYGSVKDKNGCETCTCLPPPPVPGTCDPRMCDLVGCQYGRLKDASGCDLCECAPPPGAASVWGGKGIFINPVGSLAEVTFNCAAGTISGALPSDGITTLPGTYRVVGGPPVPPGAPPTPPEPTAAEYTIGVKRDYMEVTVHRQAFDKEVGPFTLTRGSKGQLELCP